MIKKNTPAAALGKAEVQYRKKAERPTFAEKLTRNMALAGLLVLVLSAMKNAQLPTGQTVLAAVQQLTQPKWDERLGAIDFVGNFFPETVAVFFDTAALPRMTAPCMGGCVHVWSEDEPYLSYSVGADRRIYAALQGQVMSVSHGQEEEKVLRLRHDDGLETMYYELGEVFVSEGDRVAEDTCLGIVMPGGNAVMEVRRAGRSINPSACIQPREAGAL